MSEPLQPPPSPPSPARDSAGSGRPAARSPDARGPAEARGKRRGPQLLIAALSAGLVLLTAAAIWVSRQIGHRTPTRARSLSGSTTAPKQVRFVPEVESRIFRVAEASGRVETQRQGRWVTLSADDVLTEQDVVRTSNGRAVLKLGAMEIELRERVEVRLDSISRAGATVDLRRGKVVARVNRDGDNLAIVAARTRAANDGVPARFVVLADEHGRVSMATIDGKARFEAAGRVVSVPAGQTSYADLNQAPAVPENIPEDVFLSVFWPPGDNHEDNVPVTGRVRPGAAVRVNGSLADVDGTGRFTANVPVKDGVNPVEVEVEDIAGRSKREARDIRKVPSRPPSLSPEPADLWKR